jgi:hypothetical protein
MKGYLLFLKITNLQYMATLLLSSLMLSTASLRIREKLRGGEES